MPFAKGQSGNPRGRKRKRDKYQRPINAAEKRIVDRLPQLVDKLLELGDGVVVEEMTFEGARVYARPPDRQALEYLLNRIMGKPTEHVEADNEVNLSGNVVVYLPERGAISTSGPGVPATT